MASRAGATDSHKVHSQEGKYETILVRGRQLNVVGRLGEGAYSIVFLVQDPGNLRRYALKRLAVKRDEDLPKLIEEMERTERLSHHPFICACYAYEVARVEGVNYAVMLLQHGGNPLVTLMKDRQARGDHFKQSDIVRLALQIGSAVSYMHHQDPPIAHRDIKAENIMESRGVFRLVDFGSASTHAYEPVAANEFLKVQSEVSSQTTLAYRAPEMCDVYRKHRIDQKVDVWALGVLIYYVMYFQLPFEETNLAILNGTFKVPTSPLYEESLLKCVRNCLVQNPQDRWSVDELLKYLCETFPEEEIIVREVMDSMKDDENPNLIKSNWLGASSSSGLSPSGKKRISELQQQDEGETDNSKVPQYHSLVCPGEMSIQELSPLCSTGGFAVAASNAVAQEAKEEEESNNRNTNQERTTTTMRSGGGGGGGLFGKLKWQGGGGGGGGNGSSSSSSPNNNNNSNIASPSQQQTSNNALDLFGPGSSSGSSAKPSVTTTSQQQQGPSSDNFFGLKPTTTTTTSNQTQQQPSSSSIPPKKQDPFAGLF